MPVTPKRSLTLAGILAASAACWIWFRVYTGIRLEDALITYRYAGQLAQGHGFVFNLGERVLGTTTPLQTLMLGLVGAIAGADRIPLASNVLMMMAAAGAGVMTCLALEAFGLASGLALFATAALLLQPAMLWMVGGGMETPLVLLFMATGLWALARERPDLAAASAALLVLTRIDGAIWAVGVLACILWQDRAALRRALPVFVALLAPWALFATVYFGSPVPNSVIAKRVIGRAGDLLSPPHLSEHLAWTEPFFAWSFPVPLIGCVAFAVGAFSLLRGSAPLALRLLAVFPFVFSAALYLGRAPIWFDWYLAPVGYASMVVGILGLSFLAKSAAAFARARGWPRWAGRVGAAIFLVIYIALLGAQGRQVAAFQRDYQINEDGTRRIIGEWLRDSTPHGAVVAMEAVGYQAYYADRQVIDLAGLVSPAVVEIRRTSRSNAEAFYRVLRELRPDYLVLRSFEVDHNTHYHGGRLFESTEEMAYFGGHYEEVRRFEAPLPRVWGETSYLTIYRRMPER